MPHIVEKTVYNFSELSDRVKERASDWWLSCFDPSDMDYTTEDFERVCNILGVTLEQREGRTMGGERIYSPIVTWDIDRGEAGFGGTYEYAKGSKKAIRDYASEDKELHRIADELSAVQRKHFYGLTASVNDHHYYGVQVSTSWTSAEGYDLDISSKTDGTVDQAMRDLASWFLKQLRAEYDYQTSQEAVAEAMEANEYEFDEDGRRV